MTSDECPTTCLPAKAEAAVHRDYEHNQARFAEFYAVQKALVNCLARLPALVRTWFESLPPREEGSGEETSASKSWRAARLSAARRRQLSAMLVTAETNPDAPGLAEFLLKSLPVETYFAIADMARPSLRALNQKADEVYRELAEKRNDLFAANYGLAKAAVRGARNYDELLSAASCGLLAAIDRYVPEGKATARFGYFANFWIRYHISRYGQKNGGIVPLPINQQRIVRKIERYLQERRVGGLPVPTALEVCSELKISADAYYWYQQRPVIISLDTFGPEENEEGEAARGFDNLIAAPAPEPDRELENTEAGIYARELLRKHVPSYQRAMLSYARRIGSLVDAAEDYLADLEVQMLDDLRGQASIALRSAPQTSHRD